MKNILSIKPLINSLAEARKAKQLTQEELGKRLGLPQSYISKFESSRQDIRLSGILEIARYLGLELMAVPVSMVPTVRSIIGGDKKAGVEAGPLYTLDDLEEENL